MTPFFVVILFQAMAGIAIVIVGLYLLWKGVLSLAGGPGSDALGLEVSKLFTIKTCSPAIGLFALGGLLLAGAAYLSRAESEILRVQGTLVGINPRETRTTLVTEHWKEKAPVPNGVVTGTVNLGSRTLFLHIIAPGFEEPEGEMELDASRAITGVLDISDVDVTQYLGPRRKTLDEVIPPSVTPTIVPAPPLQSPGEKPAWNAGG